MDLCMIKGNSRGLQLYLAKDCDFMDLIMDICTKFMQNRATFGHTEVCLELIGRELDFDETRAIVESIELNSDVKVLMLLDGGRLKEKEVKEKMDRFYYEKGMENAKIIKTDIKAGEVIQSDYSVLVLGDVKEGGEISVKGNVIVLGNIYGKVNAGVDGDEDAFIVTSAFESEDISVAGYTNYDLFVPARGLGKFFPVQKKAKHECACIYRKELVIEPLENGILEEER